MSADRVALTARADNGLDRVKALGRTAVAEEAQTVPIAPPVRASTATFDPVDRAG